MALGKDIDSSDGLGGVRKAREPRQPVPAYPSAASDAVAVARGSRPGESRVVSDQDQVARMEHTQPAPVEPAAKDHAPASQEGAGRTPEAPFQDARMTPSSASAWEASPASRSERE